MFNVYTNRTDWEQAMQMIAQPFLEDDVINTTRQFYNEYGTFDIGEFNLTIDGNDESQVEQTMIFREDVNDPYVLCGGVNFNVSEVSFTGFEPDPIFGFAGTWLLLMQPMIEPPTLASISLLTTGESSENSLFLIAARDGVDLFAVNMTEILSFEELRFLGIVETSGMGFDEIRFTNSEDVVDSISGDSSSSSSSSSSDTAGEALGSVDFCVQDVLVDDVITSMPSNIPSNMPSNIPSERPSNTPSETPSAFPSEMPTEIPTDMPTNIPTISSAPSSTPSTSMPVVETEETDAPTSSPVAEETNPPTTIETNEPTSSPTSGPTTAVIAQPGVISPAFIIQVVVGLLIGIITFIIVTCIAVLYWYYRYRW